jgi:histidinol-phosphate aminotransferase
MSCDFLRLAAPGVRTLQPYQPGKPESELRREYGLSDVIKLASNENPLGPSPKASTAIQSISLKELARYPEGNGFALKQALATRHQIPMASITLGNGSNDVLEMVARLFLTPDHEAVFSAHAFAVYALVTRAIGATARVAKANARDHRMAYGHDLAAMQALINERTRVVFIANPNNPTGTWLSADALESFLNALPKHVIVVVDEAYFEYVEEPDYPDTLAWIEDFPNLIVTRTFSKAYGLAGLRVGYAVSHPTVADLLNRVRQPFNVNSLALVAATAALEDTAHLAQTVAVNRSGMCQLRSAFADLGLRCLPSAGNFLCVDVGCSGQQVFAALLAKGVIVRPVDNYALPNFLRITVGNEPENRQLIAALGEVLGELKYGA